MSKVDIIRAWKDEAYLAQLSDSDKAQLPKNPAGFIELSDEELTGVAGQTGVTCVTAVISAITAITAAAGCNANNKTVANGTCKVRTKGCC